MLSLHYNFAIYTESSYGRVHYQGYGLTSGVELEGEIIFWLPVGMPRKTAEEAKLDCYTAHGELVKRGLGQTGYRLDPFTRLHDWSGTRRILSK